MSVSYDALDGLLRHLAECNKSAAVAREAEWRAREAAELAADGDDEGERERTYAAWQAAIISSHPEYEKMVAAKTAADYELSRLLRHYETLEAAS